MVDLYNIHMPNSFPEKMGKKDSILKKKAPTCKYVEETTIELWSDL